MITVLRILFGFATFFIISFVSVLLARMICRHDMEASEGRFRAVAWVLSTLLASVFVTLWFISKGIL